MVSKYRKLVLCFPQQQSRAVWRVCQVCQPAFCFPSWKHKILCPPVIFKMHYLSFWIVAHTWALVMTCLLASTFSQWKEAGRKEKKNPRTTTKPPELQVSKCAAVKPLGMNREAYYKSLLISRNEYVIWAYISSKLRWNLHNRGKIVRGQMNKASKFREELAEEGKCHWWRRSEQTFAIERFVFALRVCFGFLRLPKARAEVGRGAGHAQSTGAVKMQYTQLSVLPHGNSPGDWDTADLLWAGTSAMALSWAEVDPTAESDTGRKGGSAQHCLGPVWHARSVPCFSTAPLSTCILTKAVTIHTVLCPGPYGGPRSNFPRKNSFQRHQWRYINRQDLCKDTKNLFPGRWEAVLPYFRDRPPL